MLMFNYLLSIAGLQFVNHCPALKWLTGSWMALDRFGW